jgi:hypothetical protein
MLTTLIPDPVTCWRTLSAKALSAYFVAEYGPSRGPARGYTLELMKAI